MQVKEYITQRKEKKQEEREGEGEGEEEDLVVQKPMGLYFGGTHSKLILKCIWKSECKGMTNKNFKLRIIIGELNYQKSRPPIKVE